MASGNQRAVALKEFQGIVGARENDIRDALPRHIPVERFRRVAMTAIQNNLQLLDAPPRELFNACVKAAQDGLLPDGREGALVCRPSRNGVTVTWQPMIAGIRKKVRNSGEIATWDVQAVYENDYFEFELGDDPFIKHRPALTDRGELVAVYSVATLKSGEKSRDVMSVDDVNRIRDRSDAYKAFKANKIKSTPWSTDYAEMAKKTLARRHAKVLPMSTDLDDLMRRDDELYDLKGVSDAEVAAPAPKRGIGSKLDMLAGPDEVIDGRTGEIIDKDDDKGKSQNSETSSDQEQNGTGRDDDDDLVERAEMILADLDHRPQGIDTDDPIQVLAYSDGFDACDRGVKRNAVPEQFLNHSKAAASAWKHGYDYAAATTDGEN